MAPRVIHLRRHCPQCGSMARAEGKMPGFPGPRPTVFDLDDLGRLAARHSLGMLLALVELLPYKQFECPRCGYSFRLTNETAKDMVVAMLAALKPVASARPHPSPRRRLAVTPAPSVPKRLGAPPTGTAVPLGSPPAQAGDWEPEGLD
jgi:ribosomal protein S27AE